MSSSPVTPSRLHCFLSFQAVSELPRPNRDSLAYLILHLQRVADSGECKMSAENLSTVMGPTIVGYSSRWLQLFTSWNFLTSPRKNHFHNDLKWTNKQIRQLYYSFSDPMAIMAEAGLQKSVMLGLIAISSDYWANFLQCEPVSLVGDSKCFIII